MSIMVIDVSFLRVSENLVGFRSLFEILLSLFAAWIAVRMVFQGKLSIIRLKLFSRGISINAKDVVIVPLRDHSSSLRFILVLAPFEGM